MKVKHVYESKPLDKNGHAHYSDEENSTWKFLLHRQLGLVKDRASSEYLKGVALLNFKDHIPQHIEVSEILRQQTGWSVEPVPALIQPEHFFSLLSKKRFPAANFIRIPEEIDYIEEPDVFHEIFGHAPLLTNGPYADFMHEFGKLALNVDSKMQKRLFRLFWFTIEFGLIKENDQIKAYGAGILSSKSEIIYATESNIPFRSELDPMQALLTPFRIDILQPKYYVIKSFEELFHLLSKDPVALAKESLLIPDHPALFEKRKKKS